MVLDGTTEEKITEEKAVQEQQQQQQCDVGVQQTDDHHHHNDDRRQPHDDATLYPPNMMSNASWFSRLIFYWPYPLLKKGLDGPLSARMLPEILTADTSNYNRDYFEKLWETEKERCHNNNSQQQGQQNQSKNQKRQQQHLKPSLHRAMLIDFFTSIWYVQPLMLAAAVAKIVQAVFLGYLIESFENPSGNNGYIFAGAIVICGLVILFEHHHVFFITWRKGMQLRVSCVATIYQKSLKLSSTHQETNASTGRIMNLASNDVERFLLAALFISHLLWSPIQSFAILVVGCTQIGPAFAIGFIILIFGFVPFQFYLSNRFAFLRSKIADITDQRVNFVSQAVQGSRVMKMSGYEYRFLDRIMLWRLKEVTQIAKANRLKAINEAMFFSCNIVVSLTIFLLHVFAFGGILTPGIVYTVFTLVNILQLELTKHFSLGVMGVSEVYVSITRIQKFLEFPERPNLQQLENNNNDNNDIMDDNNVNDDGDATSDNNKNNRNDDDIVISISNVDCYWNYIQQATAATPAATTELLSITDESADASKIIEGKKEKGNDQDTDDSVTSSLIPALSDINLDLRRGQLTCVIGTVGSGKSALLQAVVGELPVYRGHISRRYDNNNNNDNDNSKQHHRDHHHDGGGIAYAAQDPWIMDGTVRENVTMGLPFSEEWYNEVIDACGLRMDFQIFLHGDSTIVGDRGVQCSGGQRSRIGLARAIYRDSDVLIADDPLSAVDAKVGRQIYHEALLGLCTRRGKCVLLATHQHQYVHDHPCVLLLNGQIECTGSYTDCIDAAGGRLSVQEADDILEDVDNLAMEESIEGDVVMDTSSKISASCDSTFSNGNNDESSTKDVSKEIIEVEEDHHDTIDDAAANVVDEATDDSKENNTSGVVQWNTYCNYIQAMGGFWTAAFILLTFCVTQAIAIWTIITFGQWAELPQEEQGSGKILGLIIGQVFLAIFLSTFRAFYCFDMTIKASKVLHDDMAKAVLRARIAFFDTNPMGRILNRFSADVGSNDDQLPQTLFDFTVILFIVIGAVFTTVITLPFVLIVLPPLIYYFIVVRRIFVSSTRELKRLEGLARSPIFSMMNEALSGIATIRANDATSYFTSKFELVHDSHTRAFFSYIACSRWVGFRMDAIAFLLMSFVCFLSVLFQMQGWFNIDPAILGLSISMLLQLASAFQWCIRQSAEIVNQMVSVERVLAYGKVESEAPLTLESDKLLDPSWPHEGAIDVKDLGVRYRPSLPLALDGASFSVPSGCRVGVVGRTGSGKSTIVQTLFRLLEAECGSINIDNVNIAEVGLHRLRTSISVIPQVPTLFSGCTVRENLDLFGIHSEEAIHMALEKSHLSEAIAELPKGINSMVSEGGTNFSVGQRQLLCLARAILSKNKILILDEATASVDRRTDQMLHESLHDSFGDATIIAVAHRLDTVIDHDYILVLGQGEVLKFGSPAELLRSNGPFSTMVDDTGEISSKDLRHRAFRRSSMRQLRSSSQENL